MTNKMSSTISVDNWHLYIHEDDVWFYVVIVRRFGGKKIIKSLFSIPNSLDVEAKFTDRLEGYLLIDGTKALVKSG